MNIIFNFNISFKNIFNNITVVFDERFIQIISSLLAITITAVAGWFLLPL